MWAPRFSVVWFCSSFCTCFIIGQLIDQQLNGVVRRATDKPEIRDSRSNLCECMEYWNCASRNGQPYSYCGISETEVCCFIDYKSEVNNTLLEKLVLNRTVPIPDRGSKVGLTSFSGKNTESPKSIGECGRQRVPANLDSMSHFAEWPWHVAILEMADDLYICGGSLISPNRVLTAAHCVNAYTKKMPRLKIRAGEWDVSTNEEPLPHIESIVNMVAIHPEFDNVTLENDIAILGLSRNVEFRDNVKPVCLPQNLDSPRPVSVSTVRRCVVTGWGRRNENSPHSIVLKEIIVPIWSNDDCERKLRSSFGPDFKLPPSAICAGDERRDACDGDGGGPLVCYSDDRWVQEGIVSFGIGCGRRESPGIYTKVSWFSSWIEAFVHSGVSNK